jgi:glucokinase
MCNAVDKTEYPLAAVDIGGTKTAVSLWSGNMVLLGKRRFPTRGTPARVIEQILASLGALLDSAGLALGDCGGIGISCGGPLDSNKGLVLSPPNLPGWDAIPLVSILKDRTGLPCFIENDANACALAEWYWGAGKGFRDLAFLTFGTGMGCGLILNGGLYRGAGNLAGEVGHVRLAEDGPEGYGKRGSWEGFCSGGGLSRMYAELTGRPEPGKYICEAAEKGEDAARRVIAISARYLGRGIALLIDIINPQCVIIGSIFARSEGLFRTIMEQVIAEETLEDSRRRCLIKPAELGETLGDYAALGVALNGLQKIPLRKR